MQFTIGRLTTREDGGSNAPVIFMRYFQLIYPEKRIVSEEVLTGWYRDEFGDEADEDATFEEKVVALIDIGFMEGQEVYK